MPSLYCTECANSGRCGCCWKETIVLTQGDTRRIREHGRLAKTGTPWRYEYYYDLIDVNNDKTLGRVRKWSEKDPLWQFLITATSGLARVIRNQSSGSCWFLDYDGCCLPMHVRPLVCRLYPYDRFTPEELPVPKQEDVNCHPDLFLISDNIAELIGIRRESAERWHKQLYDEIREEMELNTF